MNRQALLALAAVIGLLVGAGIHPARADSTVNIKVDNYIISFPNEVVFSLEADAPFQISKITLNFRAGSTLATRYGYPEFTPGNQVRATYRLKTSGGENNQNYLPPFTTIRYWYVFEGANGERVQTPEKSFLYQDTRFIWKTLEKDTVTVFYYGGADATARLVLETGLQTLDKMGREAGIGLERPVKIILYNTKPDMDGAIPFTSATSRRELITAGQAYSEHDLVLVLGVGRDVVRTVAHELTHLITHQLTDNPYRQIPAWLNEGLSMYAEGDLYGEYKRALDNAIRQDRLMSVKQMTTMPGRPEDVILLYGEAHSLVKFLIDRYGPEKMRQFLATYKEGTNDDDALRRVYGFDRDGLYAQWRQSLGLPPQPAGGGEAPGGAAQPGPQAPGQPAPPRPAPTAQPSAAAFPVLALLGAAVLGVLGLAVVAGLVVFVVSRNR